MNKKRGGYMSRAGFEGAASMDDLNDVIDAVRDVCCNSYTAAK